MTAQSSGPKVFSSFLYFLSILYQFHYQLTVLTLFLTSPTLPSGKRIELDVTNAEKIAEIKKNPINIKEGVEYK